MKLKMMFAFVAVCGAVGLVLSVGGANAVAGDQAAVATASLGGCAMAGTDAEFVGSKKCKMCHSKQYKSWEESTHAKAFELLKPGEAKEAKEKFKLDPAKDYTTDKACLACHSTGFGHKGGYAVPDAADEKAVKKAKKLAHVGCESCHGGGKVYGKVKKAIKKEKRKYKLEELTSVGLIKIDAKTCTACHNEKSPTYDEAKKFKYEEMVKCEKGVHVHEPLKLRED